jgi:serine/threonine-protein kinase
MIPTPPLDGNGPASGLPERVGRYEVLLRIASGGMATVYLACARGLAGFEREVALKLVHPHLRESQAFVVDLIEEAKLAVRIRHPNVVPVLDVEEDPFGVFLVMDYVEGDSLSGLVRAAAAIGSHVPAPIWLRILLDALAGLHAAHELRDEHGRPVNLVHRDFSPQNILVGTDGVSRLTDFGIAKAQNRLTHTETGAIKGKIAYMSPEQALGQALDRRCDVWAAGVIAWELFARRPLYDTTQQTTALLEIVNRDPPRLSDVRCDIPAALDDAIAHALSRDIRRRWSSAATLATKIQEACGDAIEIADHTEVAQYVERMLGPDLVKRRAAAADLLSRRPERASSGAPSFRGTAVARNAEQNPALEEPRRPAEASVLSSSEPAAPTGLEGIAASGPPSGTLSAAAAPPTLQASGSRRTLANSSMAGLLASTAIGVVAAILWFGGARAPEHGGAPVEQTSVERPAQPLPPEPRALTDAASAPAPAPTTSATGVAPAPTASALPTSKSAAPTTTRRAPSRPKAGANPPPLTRNPYEKGP